jgi:ribosomal-protein-alanine N-acetyltransferase
MDEIETVRLRLRMFTTDDLDDLSLIFGDEEVVRHIGSGKPAPREETEVALDSILRHWERHGFGRWAAVDKQNNKLIGYGGLRNFEGTPELVYLLARSYWRKGLGTEMAQGCLKYGFEERGFERIVGLVKPANAASHHVMEKLGMNYDKHATVYGMDVVCYSLSGAHYQLERHGHLYVHHHHLVNLEATSLHTQSR